MTVLEVIFCQKRWHTHCTYMVTPCCHLLVLYIHSLQRHLTQDSEIQRQYEQKVDQYKEQLDKAEQQISDITDELNRSIKERNVAIQSRNQLSQDLHTEQERSEKLVHAKPVAGYNCFITIAAGWREL